MTITLAGVYRGVIDSSKGLHKCPFASAGCPGYLSQVLKTGYSALSPSDTETANPDISEPKGLKTKHQWLCSANPSTHHFIAVNVRSIYKLKKLKPLWTLQENAFKFRVEQGTAVDVEAWKAKQPKPMLRMKGQKPLKRWRNLRRVEYIK